MNQTEQAPTDPIIMIRTGGGDYISFHQHNSRKAHCVECAGVIPAGRGIKRQVRFSTGSGYLCHLCAGVAILSVARYANDIPNSYRYAPASAVLSPFDGTLSCYAIPAAALAQAYHDHGATGLKFAAESLREQIRAEFLTTRNIPYLPENTYSQTLAVPA